jgi:hypothetical protein
VLPAYIINKYIKLVTFYSTYIANIFKDFIINNLLPLYNPYLGPRLVIIIDNALVY